MLPESSPTGRDFMRAICERPYDDAPRLIFADWLEEQGEDERAEYIRLAIELDPDLGKPIGYFWDNPNLKEKYKRYTTLHAMYSKNAKQAFQYYYSHLAHLDLRRGFLDSVTFPAKDYKQCARRAIENLMQPITAWKLYDVEIQLSRNRWVIGTIVVDGHRVFPNEGVAAVPFATPKYNDGGWPTRLCAEAEFPRMLVDWAKGVDQPAFTVRCNLCEGYGLVRLRDKPMNLPCSACKGAGGIQRHGILEESKHHHIAEHCVP